MSSHRLLPNTVPKHSTLYTIIRLLYSPSLSGHRFLCISFHNSLPLFNLVGAVIILSKSWKPVIHVLKNIDQSQTQ